MGSEMKSMVQFMSCSTPKKISSGRPVSLHVGKGIYSNLPEASVICDRGSVLVNVCLEARRESYVFTGIAIELLAHVESWMQKTYVVLFRQVTGMASPAR